MLNSYEDPHHIIEQFSSLEDLKKLLQDRRDAFAGGEEFVGWLVKGQFILTDRGTFACTDAPVPMPFDTNIVVLSEVARWRNFQSHRVELPSLPCCTCGRNFKVEHLPGMREVWLADKPEWQHRQCYLLAGANSDREYFFDIMQKAGFRNFYLQDIPNGYHVNGKLEDGLPWFRAITPFGSIQVGWRKRVISLEFEYRYQIDEVDAWPRIDQLFPDEEVTKDETRIHAWDRDKAIEYLTVVREAAEKNP